MALFGKIARWWLAAPDCPITPFRALIWWEGRRLLANLIVSPVCVAGLLIYDRVLESYPPFTEAGEEDYVAIEMAILLFLGFNVVYLFAGFAEALVRIWIREKLLRSGPRVMLGLILLTWVALPELCWWHYHATLRSNLENST